MQKYPGSNKDAFDQISKLTYKEKEGLLTLYKYKSGYLTEVTKDMVTKYFKYKELRLVKLRARAARKAIFLE